jgi:hypothetical protein
MEAEDEEPVVIPVKNDTGNPYFPILKAKPYK